MKIAKKSKKIYLLFKFTKKKLLSLLVIEKNYKLTNILFETAKSIKSLYV